MLKRTKMFAGVVPIKLSMQELKHETELLSKNFWFHCHVVTIVYASATVLRTVCKRKASEHVKERPTKIIRRPTALQETNTEEEAPCDTSFKARRIKISLLAYLLTYLGNALRYSQFSGGYIS